MGDGAQMRWTFFVFSTTVNEKADSSLLRVRSPFPNAQDCMIVLNYLFGVYRIVPHPLGGWWHKGGLNEKTVISKKVLLSKGH